MKTFFSSFKNAFLSIVCAIVVLAAAGVGISYAVRADEKDILDRNAALESALADAGLSESEITVTKQKLDQENGKNCYEIEFFTESYEYEYVIDATTGKVSGVNIEALFDKPGTLAGNTQGNPDGGTAPEGTEPGQDTSQPADSQETGSQGTGGQPSGSQDASQPADGQQTGSQGTEGQPSGSQSAAGQSSKQISLETAKEKALADAGVSASDATFTKGKLDLDNGIYVYDIEFYTASTEYEYEINAVTGAVVDKETEAFHNNHSASSSGASGSQSSNTSATSGGAGASQSTYIGVDRAKEIVADDAGVKLDDVVFTKSKLELDDGIYIYDMEFYTGSAEYEYEVNAVTGEVLDKDMETFRTEAESGAGTAGSYIGVDRAKEIAVGHAGVSADDVYFTKTKVERDDGCTQYEIEFCHDTSEYEYCIDAFTGSILEYDCDHGGCDHHDGHH